VNAKKCISDVLDKLTHYEL